MKYNSIFIGILIVTNILTFSFLLLQEPKAKKHFYLELEGESKHWKIENQVMEITSHERYEGNGDITFRGETVSGELISPKVEFYNWEDRNYHTSQLSLSPKNNYSRQLGGGGYMGDVENFPTIDEIKNKYAIIKWNGKQEKLDLHLVGDSN